MSNANSLMKGHTFAKGKNKLTYPAIAEFKLDEIRLDVRIENGEILFRSFADKPLHNLEKFADKFSAFMIMHSLKRLDCGVLVNRSFNDTYRYTRSSKGLPADLVIKSVDFILFDLPYNCDSAFSTRVKWLDKLAAHARYDFGIDMIRPPRTLVYTEEEVDLAYADALYLGYEGLMVKSTDHTYQVGKRVYGWLKYKPEEDCDGVIQGFTEAIAEDGTPHGRAGSVLIAMPDGSTANCGGIAHDLARMMWEHPEHFIGKWAEFVYMMRDRQGGYRHPRFKRIREDKE